MSIPASPSFNSFPFLTSLHCLSLPSFSLPFPFPLGTPLIHVLYDSANAKKSKRSKGHIEQAIRSGRMSKMPQKLFAEKPQLGRFLAWYCRCDPAKFRDNRFRGLGVLKHFVPLRDFFLSEQTTKETNSWRVICASHKNPFSELWIRSHWHWILLGRAGSPLFVPNGQTLLIVLLVFCLQIDFSYPSRGFVPGAHWRHGPQITILDLTL